jgi:hypothetical protein
METTTYYNAKPSNISNLGADVSGAKRMNFDTYENPEEKEQRKRKNKVDKALKNALKVAVLADPPNRELIAKIYGEMFCSDYGFSVDDNARAIIMERRGLIKSDIDRKAFNKLVSDYNKTIRAVHDCSHDYRFKRFIDKLRKRYAPKDSFVDQTGKVFNWSEFKAVSNIEPEITFLKDHSRAVQFGNSVSDKERASIMNELSSFIKAWQSNVLTSNADITPISWSFGARGNAKSVAFYQPSGKIISVNRNNIGSLIHEIGHYLDYRSNKVSDEISFATTQRYFETLPKEMSYKQRRYYCSRVEIFARAFEAYCYKMRAGFSEFAQCGGDYLPELNDELTALIEKALKS